MVGTSVRARRRDGDDKEISEEAKLQALLEGDEDESYDEYVPLKERRRREAERRSGKLGKNKRDREREILEQERCAGKRVALRLGCCVCLFVGRWLAVLV